MQPHDGFAAGGTELHEVAELVRHPEPPPARLIGVGAAAVDERVVDSPSVLDFADEPAVVLPDPQDARAAAVADAVREDLVHRQHEVVRARGGEPGVGGAAGDEPAPVGEVRAVELEHVGVRRWAGQRQVEGASRACEPAIAPAGAPHTVPHDDRVAAKRLLDHRAGELRDVVGTEEPPRRRVGERDVQERLVPLALDELVGGALRPDRLADSPHRPVVAQMLLDELLPGRDDPGGDSRRRRPCRRT